MSQMSPEVEFMECAILSPMPSDVESIEVESIEHAAEDSLTRQMPSELELFGPDEPRSPQMPPGPDLEHRLWESVHSQLAGSDSD